MRRVTFRLPAASIRKKCRGRSNSLVFAAIARDTPAHRHVSQHLGFSMQERLSSTCVQTDHNRSATAWSAVDSHDKSADPLAGLLPGDPVLLTASNTFGFLQHVSTNGSQHTQAGGHCAVLKLDGMQIPDACLSSVRPALQTIRSPDVSVQVVTFERPRFLRHALELIAKQDARRETLEVVIVDDSPVCTLESGVFTGFDEAFIRDCVRYVHLDWGRQLPIGAKRNLATMLCRGQVVMHWDDDDYYGPMRVRLQSAPILSGEVDVTLVPLVWSFHAGDACGPDGFYRAAHNTGGHMCTLAYRRSLWSAEDTLRQYAEASLMEDLFFFRNLTGLHGAVVKDIEAGAIDFVYLNHSKSVSAGPRVGQLSRKGPDFLPPATTELFGQLRDETPATAPAQTINDQVQQEMSFLKHYVQRSSEDLQVPRKYFMDLARMIPMIPVAKERDLAVENLADKLQKSLTKLDSGSFAMAAWCCSTLRLPASNEFWKVVSSVIQEATTEVNFSASDLSMLAYVAGRVGLKYDVALVQALVSRMNEALSNFQPQDIVNLISAMARLELQDESLLSSLMSRYGPGSYSPEEWLRLTWSVSRLKLQWAEERLYPRFIQTPPGLTDRIFKELSALKSRNGAVVCGSGDVPVVLLRGFATHEECRELRRIAERQGFERTENVVRKVHVAILNRPGTADHPLVLGLRARAAKLLGVSPSLCESLHCVRYEDDERHNDHYDYVQEVDVKWAAGQKEPRMDSLLMGGQRHSTVLLYLTSLAPGEGGETVFEHLGVKVRPEMGAALIWPNIGRDGRPDPRTKHASLPLDAEEKLVANLWLRSENVEYLRNIPAVGAAGLRPARQRS